MTSRLSMPRVPGTLCFAIEVRHSSIDSRGIFALEPIAARRKVGSLGGELITQREARARAKERRRIAIVELWNGKAIDASVGGNAFRYINHSCSPNTYMRILGEHVEFYALHDIRAGEELTCDYGETHHDNTLPCKCGSSNCRGYI